MNVARFGQVLLCPVRHLWENEMTLEHKFIALGDAKPVESGVEISGYASLFGKTDQGGDMVQAGGLCRVADAARGEGEYRQDALAA